MYYDEKSFIVCLFVYIRVQKPFTKDVVEAQWLAVVEWQEVTWDFAIW